MCIVHVYVASSSFDLLVFEDQKCNFLFRKLEFTEICKLILSLVCLNAVIVFRVQTVRHSRYSAEYLDPTVSKEELEKPLDKDDPRRFQPVKAAANEHTTSCTYDPYVA